MPAPRRPAERDILADILLHIGRGDVRLFRNNVGVLQDRNGQYVNYGLARGSSDLIGWRTVTITPSMVGQQLAVFAAIEVKSATGRVSDEQQNFIDAVNRAGGYAGVARSIEEAGSIVYVEP